MPYREKTAWLALAALIVTFVPYFAAVAVGPFRDDPLPNLRQLGLYAAAAILRAVILGIGTLCLRRQSPEDARMPLDERDRSIMHRAGRCAYFVMMFGIIVVGCVMPFNYTGWPIINTALFMIFAAETVNYGVIVANYRKQAS